MPTSGTLEMYQPLSVYRQQQERVQETQPVQPTSVRSPQPQVARSAPSSVRMSKAEALTIVQRLKRVLIIGSLLFFGTTSTLIAGYTFESTLAAQSVHSTTTTTTVSATKTATATSTAASSTLTQGGGYSFGSSSSSSTPVSSTGVS